MNLATIFQMFEILAIFNFPVCIMGFIPEDNYFLIHLVAARAWSAVMQRYPQIPVDTPVIIRFFINCHQAGK